jgi:hypothetical protein
MGARTKLLVAASLLAISLSAPALRPSPPAAAPVLATEDSLREYTVPETTRVRATRIPLLELIRKAQEGERRKYDGIQTMAYNRTLKVTLEFGGRKPRTECHENVARVYFRRPNQWAEVTLRTADYDVAPDGTRTPREDDEQSGGVRVEAGDESASARKLEEIPEYLQNIDRFDFNILKRHLRVDEVLYEIGFEPRSDFEMLPSGRIWLLTSGYQIVREEFEFKKLPLPGILKSVKLVTREWQEVEHHWVEKRITARANIGVVPAFGAPKAIEVVLLYDEYKFDLPIEDAVFEGTKR